MSDPDSIVVFLPNWVGDVVMATPLLSAIQRRFAGGRIALLGRPVALDVLKPAKWVDRWIVDAPAVMGAIRRMGQLASSVRGDKYELAILLRNSFRSALLARLAGIRRIAGYDRDGRGWMLTDKLLAPRGQDGRFTPVPAIDYYLGLGRLLGAQADSKRMSLPVDPAAEAEAEALLTEAGVDRSRPIVMLNPGGSFGISKMWDPDRYAAVADDLAGRCDAQIIINAAPSDKRVAADVAAEMRTRPAINFARRDNTIALLKSLLARCDLLITIDTGARHVAAAMGTAVVTLFGSTDPAWTVIDYDGERIVRVDVTCGPCQKKMCPQPAGPFYHQCMAAITPDMVLAAADELLAQPVEAGRGGRP